MALLKRKEKIDTNGGEKAVKKVEKKAKPTEKSYDVILAPVVTEKALKNAGGEQVFFKVALTATKTEVKNAVQALFGAKVVSVNTITTKGKRKSFGRHLGCRSDAKKAVVTLAKGQQIDLTKGIK